MPKRCEGCTVQYSYILSCKSHFVKIFQHKKFKNLSTSFDKRPFLCRLYSHFPQAISGSSFTTPSETVLYITIPFQGAAMLLMSVPSSR